MPRFGQAVDVIARIRAKTIFDGECWRFTGKKVGGGYGGIWYKDRTIRIGRLICHLYYNADLKDHSWVACHTDNCRFHDCWNPTHLKIATQQDNVNDQIRTGSFSYGTDNLNGVRNRKVQW